jgi:FMN reductase
MRIVGSHGRRQWKNIELQFWSWEVRSIYATYSGIDDAQPEIGDRSPYIVGIGGTPRPDSVSERALRIALAAAAAKGATTSILTAADLSLPMYAQGQSEQIPSAGRLVSEFARADGIILSSPGYHGTVSGLIKNALDYAEDLRDADIPYLEGRAVGCIACAAGWQATTTTLISLRMVVHALRGWPTPLGVVINSAQSWDGQNTGSGDSPLHRQLEMVGHQVVWFALLRNHVNQLEGSAVMPGRAYSGR